MNEIRSSAVLIAALRQAGPRSRLRAARELARRGDPGVVPPLLEMARDRSDGDTAEEALHILCTLLEANPAAIRLEDLEKLADLDVPDVHYSPHDQKSFLMDQGRYPAQPSEVCSLARRALRQRSQ